MAGEWRAVFFAGWWRETIGLLLLLMPGVYAQGPLQSVAVDGFYILAATTIPSPNNEGSTA